MRKALTALVLLASVAAGLGVGYAPNRGAGLVLPAPLAALLPSATATTVRPVPTPTAQPTLAPTESPTETSQPPTVAPTPTSTRSPTATVVASEETAVPAETAAAGAAEVPGVRGLLRLVGEPSVYAVDEPVGLYVEVGNDGQEPASLGIVGVRNDAGLPFVTIAVDLTLQPREVYTAQEEISFSAPGQYTLWLSICPGSAAGCVPEGALWLSHGSVVVEVR